MPEATVNLIRAMSKVPERSVLQQSVPTAAQKAHQEWGVPQASSHDATETSLIDTNLSPHQEMVTERVQAELRMLLETGRIQIPEQPDASVDPPADQRGAGLLSADSKAPDALAGAGGGQPGLSTEEPR